MSATFQDHEVKSGLKDKRKLSAFLAETIHSHLQGIKKIRLDYVFCTDAYLLQINQQFLQHDTLTDIVTFDLSETEDEVRSEIYISIDRVKENAQHFKVSYMNELHRVIFHGALHLCGFEDKSNDARLEMRQREDVCLKAYGFMGETDDDTVKNEQ